MKVVKKQPNTSDCVICGINNEFGLKAPFYETKNNEIVTIFEFKEHHQSYPGRTHGGLVSTMLDELIGRAIWIYDPNQWGVTMTLNIKYRKPTPYNTKLKGVGRIDSQTSRTFTGSGEIYDMNGNVLAEATANYMKLPIEKIADNFSKDHDVNIYIPDNVTEV